MAQGTPSFEQISEFAAHLPVSKNQYEVAGRGTRHAAALGLSECCDALVIVVSEERGTISVVMGGEMLSDLDAPHLRVALREILGSERRELPTSEEISRPLEVAEAPGNETGTERSAV